MYDPLYADEDPDPEPQVLDVEEGLKQVREWIDLGTQLQARSPELALEFYRFTPAFLKTKNIHQIREWAREAIHILDICKSADSAAIAYLQSSPRMHRFFPITGFRGWKAVGLTIARQSGDLASTYFALWPDGLDSLYQSDVTKILELVALITVRSPEEALEFYRRAPQALADLNPNVRKPLLQTALKISSNEPERVAASFHGIVTALRPLSNPAQERVMALEPAIGELSIEACSAYFGSVGTVVSQISEDFLGHWVDEGLSLAAEDTHKGIEYFSLKANEAHEQILKWKEAVRLEDTRHVLSIFAHALTGKEMCLKSTDDREPDAGSPSRHYSEADGHTIFLPPCFAEEQTRQENFRLYKVAVAHHAGYVEFGTFDAGLPAIRSFLASFPQRDLAADIFFILEDGRIDRKLKQEYAGLSKDIDLVLCGAMSRRPFPHGDPLREALEVLLRLSVGLLDASEVSPEIARELRFMKEAVAEFYKGARHVTDTLTKTAEIYQALCKLVPADGYRSLNPLPYWERPDLDLDSGGGFPSTDTDEIVAADEKLSGMGLPLSPEEIEKLLEKLKDLPFQKNLDGGSNSQGLYVRGSDIEAGDSATDPSEGDPENRDRPVNIDAPRTVKQLGPFYYDEWDYLQGAYRKRWCCLREEQVPALAPGLFEEIYDRYGALIQKVRRQFQQIRPEILETVSRVDPGDEIDFPSMIQSVVDRKAGGDPSEKIFSRKERKIRRISTLLLIDMSASTSENVPVTDTSRAASSATDRAEPLQTRKRIIDIEIESLVVMTEALEALDDEYAIFGFSGRGRHRVDFYAIKDFSDPYSDDLKRRIGGIVPKQGTRMGPAIRHATEKLRLVESDHRLMILLSDGFPQDTDYGEDTMSKEYGLHDTKMALVEARKAGIRPFCLTVDQAGNDYLRKMCDPTSYLVIHDIHSLPEVLPKVVESLMM